MLISVNKARELVRSSVQKQLEKDVSLVIESAAKEGATSCLVIVDSYQNAKTLLKSLLDIGYTAYAMSDYEINISWAEECIL